MIITEVIVSGCRTFNDPHEAYKNHRHQFTIKAQVESRDNVSILIRDLTKEVEDSLDEKETWIHHEAWKDNLITQANATKDNAEHSIKMNKERLAKLPEGADGQRNFDEIEKSGTLIAALNKYIEDVRNTDVGAKFPEQPEDDLPF